MRMKGKEEDLQVTGRKGLAMCMFVWPSPVPGHHSLSYFSLIKSFPDYLCICTLFSANSWRDLDVGEQAQRQLPELGWGKAPWPAVLAAAASGVGCHQLPGSGRAVCPGELWMAGQGESV